MSENKALKDDVYDHIVPFATEKELKDHSENTTDTLSSQKDFLCRLVSEREDNPMASADTIKCISGLDSSTICPFINGHLAEEY